MDIEENISQILLQYGVRILLAIFITILGMWLIRILLRVMKKWKTGKMDQTLVDFLQSLIKALLYILLFITVASTVGIEMTSFIALFGAVGLAVGLSLQGSLANFAGGILILAFRPFNVGDMIEIKDFRGKVKSIQILYTTIITPDNRRVVLPNGEVANNSIININIEDTRRVQLVFGISYDDDIIKVKNLLNEIVANHELILKEPEPIIRVAEHADSSINFNCFVWAKTADYWTVHYDLLEEVKLAFDREDITIPYPQMDIHLNNLEK
ncbi:mechanosensitive ion channel family protein [Natronospora cellulosivora (SeqCode)]